MVQQTWFIGTRTQERNLATFNASEDLRVNGPAERQVEPGGSRPPTESTNGLHRRGLFALNRLVPGHRLRVVVGKYPSLCRLGHHVAADARRNRLGNHACARLRIQIDVHRIAHGLLVVLPSRIRARAEPSVQLLLDIPQCGLRVRHFVRQSGFLLDQRNRLGHHGSHQRPCVHRFRRSSVCLGSLGVPNQRRLRRGLRTQLSVGQTIGGILDELLVELIRRTFQCFGIRKRVARHDRQNVLRVGVAGSRFALLDNCTGPRQFGRNVLNRTANTHLVRAAQPAKDAHERAGEPHIRSKRVELLVQVVVERTNLGAKHRRHVHLVVLGVVDLADRLCHGRGSAIHLHRLLAQRRVVRGRLGLLQHELLHFGPTSEVLMQQIQLLQILDHRGRMPRIERRGNDDRTTTVLDPCLVQHSREDGVLGNLLPLRSDREEHREHPAVIGLRIRQRLVLPR